MVDTTNELRFGPVAVRPAQRQVLVDGNAAALGARALDVLFALVERRDRIVSKDELIEQAWHGLVVEENNLQVQVSTLRKVLGPDVIATIPGRGYRFTALLDDAITPPAGSAPQRPAAPPGNLPLTQPPLFGRADDLAALATMLESHRLVSIVGAGGIGKTVLAQAVARRARDRFPDGVWQVELARQADGQLVVETIATTLQISLARERDAGTLAHAIGDSRMLVVLDNCEHVAETTAAAAAALLADAPNLRLLVTTQEPLRIVQENVYRLSPLLVPARSTLGVARASGAVALFEARARAADPRFVLNEDNVASVVDICYRLDGIPLAIELAAVRVPLLGVEGLREKLDTRFRVLTSGARQGLRRHQTLRAALDWSHGLLSRDEQAVFRRLGVFVGGFVLKPAQWVASDARIDVWTALEHIGALVEKSLVLLDDAPGEPRYRLLETTRAYAREKLDESGEIDRVALAHARAMLDVFEGSLRDEYVLPATARLERYLPELENARAALDWAQDHDDALFVALAGAVAWIWVGAGQRLEGVRRSRAAMAKITGATPAAQVARLLIEWKTLAWIDEGAKVVPHSARALELYRSLGDAQALHAALCRHAECFTVDAAAEAERLLDEAGRLWQPDWPTGLRLHFFWVRGCLLMQQWRGEEALATADEAIRLATLAGDARMGLRLRILAEQSAALVGRFDECVARGREMLSAMAEDRRARGELENIILTNLCMALARVGAVEEALDVGRRAVVACERAGRLSCVLDGFAMLACLDGRHADGARVLGRADRAYQERNLHREATDQSMRDEVMTRLRATLRPDLLAALLVEGQQLSTQLAVRLVLQD
jgi:predicted ATPase/DNA-binding winged helix-turn-helix (wHTH) protein